MISAENLKKAAKEMLTRYIDDKFPYDHVAEELHAREVVDDMELSPYGYVMWAIDHYGYKCAYKNLMSSSAVISGYADAAVKFRDDMPIMLLNAHKYVTSILSNVADLEVCLKHLEGMTFPYVLYTLFAGSGQADIVERYRPEMEEQMKRYPSTLDLLPESYKNVGKEILHADTE